MSIFDPVEKELKELEELVAMCLTPGATIIECADPTTVLSRIENLNLQTRPIIHWDVKSFKKFDAIGSMYALSRLPKAPRPIVIIENIADIPNVDQNVYDDPEYVENVLLHSWRSDTIHLTHPKEGSFQLNKWDYTVIILVKLGDLQKLHHRFPDGVGLVTTAF